MCPPSFHLLALISSPTESISSKGSKENNLQVESATHPWVKHTETSLCLRVSTISTGEAVTGGTQSPGCTLKSSQAALSQARFHGFQTDAKGGLDTLVHCFHPC